MTKKTLPATVSLSTGIPALDSLLQGLRAGDNVVWQTDSPERYREVARPLVAAAVAHGRPCVYLRFAQHLPLIQPALGVKIIELSPKPGFDSFCAEVYHLVKSTGEGAFYVFDDLSTLVDHWHTDEQLANFFQVICPILYELKTIAYFGLTRGLHSHGCVTRIRDTTQVMLDLFQADQGKTFIQPVKVLGRYTPTMFCPHLVSDGERWSPVFRSGDASRLCFATRRPPFGSASDGASAPWEAVYRKLQPFKSKHPDIYCMTLEDEQLKRKLIAMLFGADRGFRRMADTIFTVGDLLNIRERVLGSGRIGGKAAGMLLARAIIRENLGYSHANEILDPQDAFYLGSDTFFTFLVTNGLFRLRLEPGTAASFPEIEQAFLAGHFPPEMVQQFRILLDYYGQAPIAVRSSSLLEDGFEHELTSAYRSEFCVNQGAPDARLNDFLRAIKLVYASMLHPNAINSRRARGIPERDEQMAVLVQRVSGMPHGHCFLPLASGVAVSTDGLTGGSTAKLIFGMGTRAEDGATGENSRWVDLMQPAPLNAPAEPCQALVDVLDLSSNRPITLALADALADTLPAERIQIASIPAADGLRQATVEQAAAATALTFNELVMHPGFAPVLRQMLDVLARAYRKPVKIEFTAAIAPENVLRINLLQCSPIRTPE